MDSETSGGGHHAAENPVAQPSLVAPSESASTEARATPQVTAERTVAGMFAGDKASQLLGMKVTHVAVGQATVTMTIRADMLNGFDICHGGLIASLADSAFAFACNSAGELTVASGIVMDYIAPAREGDLLTATAHEVSRTSRTGVYDVEVTNQTGARVAVLRGRSFTVRGKPSLPGSVPAG